ncbi:MFS general substrate transporter-47 [Coleophoma crateriformis]|uniref:Quinate transporter n=1 Tax=Coleophoma crateriformis TaxID=565419 RepID=A0A3D8T1R1_9HELO|nr:MFS general substrate transporter-47 [Coleophoma crateriformis]
MGLLTKVEDRPTPSAVYNWRVYFSAAIASFAAVMIGYDSAFIGGTLALPSFVKEFGWGTAQKSVSEVNFLKANVVSLYQAGAFFGAFFAYPAGHFLGRKWGLTLFSGIFVIGAGMMLGANGSRGLGLIYGGRVLAGIGVGAASNLTPIYISEIAPPAIRGRLVGLYELGWQIGGLVGFWINYGVSTTMASSHQQWIIPFAIQIPPAVFLFVGSLFLAESPRWLLSKGRREAALKNLSWLRQLPTDDMYMLEEISACDMAIESQRSSVGLGFWQPFKTVINSKKVMYRFFLGGALFFWQNASGINAINYYSPTIFKSIGVVGTNSSLLTTGIFGVIKTVFTFVWLLILIDKLGRRNLLLIGAVGGSICLWIVGSYIAIAEPTKHPKPQLGSGGIAAMFFFYLWTAFYTPSWNGTPWVLNSEMFDQNVRTLAQAFAAANNWLWNFLVARFTPQMFAKMDYGVYFFFATLMLCSVVFVWFLIPETKGVPLEAMDRLFELSKQGPARKAHGLIMAELIEQEEEFRHNAEGSGLSVEKTRETSKHLESVQQDQV